VSSLISAEELRAAPSGSHVILDCRSGAKGSDAYAAGHLVGARRVDLDRDLSGPKRNDARDGGRHPLPDVHAFARLVGELGIHEGSDVVAYDDAGGANAAARAWWMLRAIGHDAVRVLDGGLRAAQLAGLAVTTELPTVTRCAPYPAAASAWTLPTVGLATVDRARKDAEWRLLDVRAPFRYRGEREPFDPVAGHIPGALNFFYEEALGENGRFLPPDVLRALFEELLAGVVPARVVVQCGSGVTACHTLLALEHAGIHGAALYVGSWSEWCRHEDLPQAKDV
jgi:thiosulfate/3-mercaptopyruvate sulfurtransferase